MMWFEEFAESFCSGNEKADHPYLLKQAHTIRVCELIDRLTGSLGLVEAERHLAWFCGLYHDLGRFEQYHRYQTFNDNTSEDHAALSLQVMEQQHLYDDFSSREEVILREAVFNHNKKEILQSFEEGDLFFSRLLRDADKIDIIRLNIELYTNERTIRYGLKESHLPDAPGLSPGVYDDLANGRAINHLNVSNQNDHRLLLIGWVYDINFAPAARMLREMDFIEKLRISLPKDSLVMSELNGAERALESKCRPALVG